MYLGWLVVTLLVGITTANDLSPINFESGTWLGNDGNWSTIVVEVGSPPQTVNVLVSTALSELWVVGPGGCLENEPVCDAARGSVFRPANSKSWQALKLWQLGLAYLGYGGNGDYGHELASGHNTVTESSFHVPDITVAAINTTDYYQGLFGLGIAKSKFEEDEAVDTPLTSAGITNKSIPSVSYGYTAGAHYRNTPSSLTLGGSDTSRYVPHNDRFVLAQSDNMPTPLVRGIEFGVNASAIEKRDELAVEVLSGWDDAFLAIVDSTTPYLWLPEWLCERFAKALNLTYNETFDLYTISDEQYQQFNSPGRSLFTFSLSSLDNRNDLGTPLDVPGVVNITVTTRAFVGLLQYPFKNEAIRYGDPAIPYFSLRKSHDNSTFILGRSFLQEAYLITKYDEASFSIHQAIFPNDPVADSSVVSIEQSPNSPYTRRDEGHKARQEKPHNSMVVGIAVGASIGCGLLFAVAFFCYRRKRHQQQDNESTGASKSPPSTASEGSTSPMGRLLSKVIKRKQPSRGSPTPSDMQELRAMEAPNSEIHEMPVPIQPVELDGANGYDDTIEELGSRDAQHLGAYEAARQKMERQLQGPVPEYTPPADGVLPPMEKDVYYPDEPGQRSPVAIVTEVPGPGTPSIDIDSPSTLVESRRATWTRRLTDIPAPIIVPSDAAPAEFARDPSSPASPSPCHPSDGTNLSLPWVHMAPSPMTPAHYPTQASPSSPVMHRDPFATPNVVYMGPLADNVQSPSYGSFSHIMHAGGPTSNPSLRGHRSQPSVDTLGSDFTEAEDRMAAESGEWHQASPTQTQGTLGRLMTLHRQDSRRSMEPDTPHSIERVTNFDDLVHIPQIVPPQSDTGRVVASRDLVHIPEVPVVNPDTPRGRVMASSDLVHVPQMAPKRYSWEEGHS